METALIEHKVKCKKCSKEIVLTTHPKIIESISAQIKNGKIKISGKCEACNEDVSFEIPLETDFSIEEKEKNQ